MFTITRIPLRGPGRLVQQGLKLQAREARNPILSSWMCGKENRSFYPLFHKFIYSIRSITPGNVLWFNCAPQFGGQWSPTRGWRRPRAGVSTLSVQGCINIPPG